MHPSGPLRAPVVVFSNGRKRVDLYVAAAAWDRFSGQREALRSRVLSKRAIIDVRVT